MSRSNQRLFVFLMFLAVLFAITAFPKARGFHFGDATLGWALPVTGHPFSAEFTWQEAKFAANLPSPAYYKHYRDSQGREVTVPPFGVDRGTSFVSPQFTKFTEIVDPIAGYWYILDSSTRTAHRSKMPARPAPSPSDSFRGLSLGNQTILGVQAEGFSTSAANGATSEKWFCNDLKLMIVVKTNSPNFSTLRQVTSLRLGEPPATLFKVPSDYTVVDEVSPYVVP
jgi:hypothetical protein